MHPNEIPLAIVLLVGAVIAIPAILIAAFINRNGRD